MVPRNFLAMYLAEFRGVFRRGSALGALAVSLLVGLAVVGAMSRFHSQAVGANINGQQVGEFIRFSGADCAGWGLRVRNFFVLPLLLLLATGSSVVGELQGRQLREDLLRAVPRWSVLAAKLLALMTLSLFSLAATLIPSLAGGSVLFGTDGPTGDLLLGYAASLLTDLGILSFGVLASLLVTSVGGVVVSVILLLMADAGVRAVLWISDKIQGLIARGTGAAAVETGPSLAEFLPGAALEAWKGWNEGWAWEPFAGLALLVVVCLGVSLWRFERMDIP